MASVTHVSSNPNPMAPNLSRSNHSRPSKVIMGVMSPNQPYWASLHAEIDVYLKQHIPLRPPLSVFEPMHHFIFSAPPSTAPALCMAACELVGGSSDQAMAAAAALHLMHSAAFIHEQLLLSNRPKPRPNEVQHAYNPGIELLTGDAIFPFGYELLCKSIDPAQDNSGRVLQVIVEITRAMGSKGMMDGKHHAHGMLMLSNQSEYKYVTEKKEGGLHACGAACGAILGGASEEEIEKLRRFGLCVGVIQAFLNRVEGNGMETTEVVKELRIVALKELEFFHGKKPGKAEAISSFLSY